MKAQNYKHKKLDYCSMTADVFIPHQVMYQKGISNDAKLIFGKIYNKKFSLMSFITEKNLVTETRYSKTVQFYDADYEIAEISKQKKIFSKYCSLLNSFDSSVKFQISVVNLTNDEDVKDVISIPEQNGRFNDIRQEYVQMLRKQFVKGNNGFM